MSACTIRVLNFPGGGERGYLSLVWWKLFLARWGIPSSEIWKYFDIISGTSIGGIAALGYAYGIEPSVLETFFVEKGPLIFTQRTNLATCSFGGISGNSPSNTPNVAQKLAGLLANDPFYLTSGSCDTYGSALLYKTLTETFGTATLQDLKTNVIIPSYRVTDPEIGYGEGVFELFSNLIQPSLTGSNETIVNVAKATSAAPIYLPAAEFGGKVYLDGGLYGNNPAQIGLSVMQSVKPTANRFCVLSVGTGLGKMQFTGDSSDPVINSTFQAFKQIFSLFDISSTGAQELVSLGLKKQANDSLSNLYQYTFQPTLDPTFDTGLDNTSPEILAYYHSVATNAFNSDLAAIDNFIGHLTA